MLHSLTGRPSSSSLVQPSLWVSALPSMLAAASAAAAAPLMADTAPLLDTHYWVHSQTLTTTLEISQATLAAAHLVEGIAPVWTHASRVWHGLHPCLPLVIKM